MCTTRILAKSQCGIIFECPSCESVQVVFGTTKMILNSTNFKIFTQDVSFMVSSVNNDNHQKETKSILIKHPDSERFSFVLTITEFTQFSNLFFQAILLQEVYHILKN